MNFRSFIFIENRFYDSCVDDIDACNSSVILSIFEDRFEDTFSDTRIIIEAEDIQDFVFHLEKRYAVNHKICTKSREVSLKKVKKLIRRSKPFMVNDVALCLSSERAVVQLSIESRKNIRKYLCLEFPMTASVNIEKINIEN